MTRLERGDHILVTVDLNEGAYRFLQVALTMWHADHDGLLETGFRRGRSSRHDGVAWCVFDPELSWGALDDLVALLESFFAPEPPLWAYVPAADALPPAG